MPCYSAKRACLAAILFLTPGGSATLRATLPINSQVPPVAYVSQPFEFTFSPTTFTSDGSVILYSLSNQPQWLSLDSNTGTFLGMPTSSDVGAAEFEITASDTTGMIAMNVTLVVLEHQSVYSDNEILQEQLARTGNVSAPTTLLLYPQQTFELLLVPDLFKGTSSSTNFYAVSADGSPLPSWAQLDTTNFHFSGITPALLPMNPSEQTYSFRLAASNVIGFSETSVDFKISISSHLIAFSEVTFNFSAARGSSIQIPSLLNNIRIDGADARRSDIVLATANPPEWLNFDSNNLSFDGTVPNSANSLTFSLTVNALGTNLANATIMILVSGQQPVTQESLGNVSAIGGSYFLYSISIPAGLENFTHYTVKATDIPGWLSFNTSNLTLQGIVPNNTIATTEVVTFLFTSASSNISSELTINIQAAPTLPTASASSTGTHTDGVNTSNTATSDDGTTSSKKRLAALVLAIVLPILAVVILTGIILAWIFKHKKQPNETANEGRSKLPSPPPTRQVDQEVESVDMPGAILPYEAQSHVTSSTPQVELSWAPDSIKRTRNRLSKKPRTSISSIVGSSWDDLIEFRVKSKESLSSKSLSRSKNRRASDAVTTVPPINSQSQQRPARPVRPASLFSQRPSEMFRASVSPVPATAQPSSAIDGRSGAGHGQGMNHPLPRSDPRSSWQTTKGTIPGLESTSNTTMFDSFPAPPAQSSTSTKGHSPQRRQDTQQTLRLVEDSSGETQSFSTARHDLHKAETENQQEATAYSASTSSKPMSRPVNRIVRSSSWNRATERTRSRGKQPEYDKTPPIPQKSQARRRMSDTLSPMQSFSLPANQSTLNRELSMASSGQFDSAASSVSQYDDEHLFTGESIAGETGPSGSRALESPLPRLIDQRKHVSIEDKRMERTERSHQGSLRFM